MDLLETRVTTPAAMATALGHPIGVVAYHVRWLHEAGLIELVERRRSWRGAIEHYYTAPQAPTIDDHDWGLLSILDRRAVVAGGLRRLGPELATAVAADGFRRRGAHVESIRVRLDERGWGSAARAFAEALTRIEFLAEAAKMRRFDEATQSGEDALVVMMLFKDWSVSQQRGAPPPTSDLIDLSDPRVVSASAHPLRARIFELIRSGEASPSDLARELGVPASNTSYHVRQLAGLGLVRLTRRREHRGSIEHYYEACAHGDRDDWVESIVDESIRRVADLPVQAASQGGFDASDIHFSRTSVALDAPSWAGALEALSDARRSLRHFDREAARASQQDSARLEVVHGLTMLFERVRGPDF
jgi:DNA-binding transcriptional ArsR family regulator